MLLIVLPTRKRKEASRITHALQNKMKRVRFQLIFEDKAIKRTSTNKVIHFLEDRSY